MKKLILTISAVLSLSAAAMAQAPDLFFETWANVFGSSTVQDPQGWASLNTLVSVGTLQSVFKETTAPNQGLASAKITTVKVNGASIPNPYTSGNIDTAGILVMGTIAFIPSPGLKYGKPLSGRPATLGFTSKYTPMAGDSAFVLVYLTRWNGASRDTIAQGKYATGTATATYSGNFITLNYNPAFNAFWADTALVFASSSIYSHGGAKIGSTFYIDAMSWSGYNGIDEMNADNKVSVFPNPATNAVNFQSTVKADAVEILDVTGRKIGAYIMTGNNVSVSAFGFAPGFYLYNVVNEKKEIIGRGKFEIAK